MLNQVVLIGKVKKIEKSASGSNYLLLAIERTYKNTEGVFLHDTIHCVLWKGIHDSVRHYYKEGQYLSVTGRLETYENMANVVIAEKVGFIGLTSKGSN